MTTEEKIRKELVLKIREKREKKQQKKNKRKTSRRLIASIVVIAMTVIMLGIAYSASAMEITITEINEFTGLNESQTVRTRGGNVEDVLREQGLDIGEHDRLNVPADKQVSNNDDIVITRGKRITIKIGDQENVATVTKADVTDALVEAGYAPGAYDDIKAEGDTIELVSISHVDETTTESIERDVEYVEDSDLPEGKEVVIDEGEDGIKEVLQKVTYTNGEESERTTVSENVSSEPRNKVIAKGTAEPDPNPEKQNTISKADDDGGSINGYRYSRKITMTATAYSTDPSENAGYSVSAMGNPLGYGIAAVDPNVIPLGSRVYVTSPDGSWVYGVASAEDTGGAIKGNKIDLCFPTNADDFGRRSCIVYVLE